MARIRSFRFAFKGVYTLITTQHNCRVHAAASILVLVLGWYLQVNQTEWLILILAIGLVWMAEALNTAIEFLGNAVSLEQHPLIGHAKDVAAAGVLIAAITAAIVGGVVFWPYV
ncbi:MAG: diacylglycerol kinase family protein [Calditrichia bacterium]